MPHGSIRGEPRCYVTTKDRVDDPIRRREREQSVGHRQAPWRIDLERVKYLIGAKRQNHTCEKPGRQGNRASPPPAGRGLSHWNCHLTAAVDRDANTSSSLS